MGITFWIRRFCVVLVGAFVVIAASHWMRGRGYDHAATQGLIWALVTAVVFTGARFFQARRGQHCAICRDTPQSRGSSDPPT